MVALGVWAIKAKVRFCQKHHLYLLGLLGIDSGEADKNDNPDHDDGQGDTNAVKN